MATAVTKLAGSAGVAGPSLQIDNNSTNAAATTLDLQVEAGKAPMTVNSGVRVANLNADKVDGKDSSAFYTGNTYTVKETKTGTTQGALLSFDLQCDAGDKTLGGGIDAPFGGTLLSSSPGKSGLDSNVIDVEDGESPNAWHIEWVPNFSSTTASTRGYLVCADLGTPQQ